MELSMENVLDIINMWIQYRKLHRDVVYLGWPIAPSYMSPKAGRGALRGLIQWIQLYAEMAEAQINFGDLTPYLTYDKNTIICNSGLGTCGQHLTGLFGQFLDRGSLLYSSGSLRRGRYSNTNRRRRLFWCDWIGSTLKKDFFFLLIRFVCVSLLL
jgi:hypothetical protein